MTNPMDRPVVIVTGSSGYVGSAVVKRLAAHYRVVGFDRHTPPHPPPEAECVCFDITDESSIDAALSRVRIAYGDRIALVIHLAAYFDLSGEPSPAYDAATVHGTERLLAGLTHDIKLRSDPAGSCMDWTHARKSPKIIILPL